MFIELTYINGWQREEIYSTWKKYIKIENIYAIEEDLDIRLKTSLVYIACNGWKEKDRYEAYERFKESPKEIIRIIMETEYNYSKQKLIKKEKIK